MGGSISISEHRRLSEPLRQPGFFDASLAVRSGRVQNIGSYTGSDSECMQYTSRVLFSGAAPTNVEDSEANENEYGRSSIWALLLDWCSTLQLRHSGFRRYAADGLLRRKVP